MRQHWLHQHFQTPGSTQSLLASQAVNYWYMFRFCMPSSQTSPLTTPCPFFSQCFFNSCFLVYFFPHPGLKHLKVFFIWWTDLIWLLTFDFFLNTAFASELLFTLSLGQTAAYLCHIRGKSNWGWSWLESFAWPPPKMWGPLVMLSSLILRNGRLTFVVHIWWDGYSVVGVAGLLE